MLNFAARNLNGLVMGAMLKNIQDTVTRRHGGPAQGSQQQLTADPRRFAQIHADKHRKKSL